MTGPDAFRVAVLDGENARVPTRADPGAAGYDLYASGPVVIPARGRALVSLGIAVTVPDGTYGQIKPRSGLAIKHGIDVGAGVIDRSYTGALKVVLFNHGDAPYPVEKGDRVAQLVLVCIKTPEIAVVGALDETSRGAGGFGSSGK